MRAVDDVLMPLIEAAVFNLDDGYVKSDNRTKIVTYPIPYAVYMSSIGDDDNRRLSGRKARLSVYFSLKFVGEDRTQVKWIGERARAVLADKRIAIPGHRTWPCQLLSSSRVFRDDDAISPDGKPLFYSVDDYALSITQTHGSTP